MQLQQRVPLGTTCSRTRGRAPPLRTLQQCGTRCRAASVMPSATQLADDEEPSFSGRPSQYVRETTSTYAPPSITDTGTLRPPAEWFPAWMRYRKREDNYVFWQDKFSRNSLDIGFVEKRWTIFSTVWFLVMQTRFYGIPPALRYFVYLGWRAVMNGLYVCHKALVLWQCKFDAYLAARAVAALNSQLEEGSAASSSAAASGSTAEPSEGSDSQGSNGSSSSDSEDQLQGPPGFSRTMALRRLHWKNCLLAEILYLVNVAKTGRVHLLPPTKAPPQRPTFFFFF